MNTRAPLLFKALWDPTSTSSCQYSIPGALVHLFFIFSLILLCPVREYGSFEATNVKEWSAVLNLADKWGFRRIRALAIKQITPIASPVDILVLNRRHSINEAGWCLADAYYAIIIRPNALTLEEGYLLGMEDVIEIASIRQDCNSGNKDLSSLSAPTLQEIENRLRLPKVVHTPAHSSAMPNPASLVINSVPTSKPESPVVPAKMSSESILVKTEDKSMLYSAASKIVGILLLSSCLIKVKLTG